MKARVNRKCLFICSLLSIFRKIKMIKHAKTIIIRAITCEVENISKGPGEPLKTMHLFIEIPLNITMLLF